MKLFIFILFFVGLIALVCIGAIHGLVLSVLAPAILEGESLIDLAAILKSTVGYPILIQSVVFLAAYLSCLYVLGVLTGKASSRDLLPVRRPLIFAIVTHVSVTIACWITFTELASW